MVLLDMKKFSKNIMAIPKEEEFDPSDGNMLKKLLLILAGDERVIKKLTLEEIENMIMRARGILATYEEDRKDCFKENFLRDSLEACRRAV